MRATTCALNDGEESSGWKNTVGKSFWTISYPRSNSGAVDLYSTETANCGHSGTCSDQLRSSRSSCAARFFEKMTTATLKAASSSSDQLVEEHEMLPGHDGPGIHRLRASTAAKPQIRAARSILEERTERVQPLTIVSLADDNSGVADDVRNLAAVRGQDRHAAGERFDQHPSELL